MLPACRPHLEEERLDLDQWFSNSDKDQNDVEGLLKYRMLISNPRNSDSVGQGWGLRICTLTLTSFQVRLLADPGATSTE